VTIDREHLRITASASSDGTLGEVIIQWGKQGATTAGLIDAYATALTTGLQHHVPLADLLTPGLDLHCAPSGRTDDPDIPRARSVIDYLARRLAIDWLPYGQRAAMGIRTISERMNAAQPWMDAQDAQLSRIPGPGRALDTLRWELATGLGAPPAASVRAQTSGQRQASAIGRSPDGASLR
jgi:hypothetical protein